MNKLSSKQKKSTFVILISVVLAGFGIVNPEVVPLVTDVVDSIVQLTQATQAP